MVFKEFKEKYEHTPVDHFPSQVKDQPIVSVCVVTYNHVNYIRQCLDGILNQKVDFDFELILGDDASTDGTREICKDYAEKYPDKIRLFLHHRENNIEIGGKPTGRFNFLYNLYSVKGRYIALCDGDDYWTDPLKLQKQLAFLEKKEDFVGVFTDINVLKDNQLKEKALKEKHRKDHDFKTFLEDAWIPTLTVFFRAICINNFPENPKKIVSGDLVLFAHLLTYGKLKFLDEVTGVYRQHLGGVWSGANQLKILNNRIELNKYFKKSYAREDKSLNLILKKRINKSHFKKAKVFKQQGDYVNMMLSLIKSKL